MRAALPRTTVNIGFSSSSSLPLTMLEKPRNLYLFAVAPSTTIAEQAGGVLKIPFGVNTLYVGLNLPGSASVTLNTPQLESILSGTVKTWGSSAVSTAISGAKATKLPITVSLLNPTGVRSEILYRYLGERVNPEIEIGSAACKTTPGCIDFSLSKPSSPVATIKNLIGQSTTPGSPGYPLTFYEEALIEKSPFQLKQEIAAVEFVKYLVALGNLPATKKLSEAAAISSSINRLSLEELASSG